MSEHASCKVNERFQDYFSTNCLRRSVPFALSRCNYLVEIAPTQWHRFDDFYAPIVGNSATVPILFASVRRTAREPKQDLTLAA